MIIDLRKLDEGGGQLSTNEDIAVEDAFGKETSIRGHIVVDYRHAGGSFYFHVRVDGKLATECHRCLERVDHGLSGEFDIVVRRGEVRHAQEGDAGEVEDYMTVARNEHEISLDDLLRENVVVNVPMIVLCRESCKGLCARCGVNLNLETCECPTGGDPRWDALRKLGGHGNNG